MKFKEYSEKAHLTAVYPNVGTNVEYCALGLIGEIGEFANKLKKVQRDSNGILTDEIGTALINELGDIMWYLNEYALTVGHTLKGINKLSKKFEKDNIDDEFNDTIILVTVKLNVFLGMLLDHDILSEDTEEHSLAALSLLLTNIKRLAKRFDTDIQTVMRLNIEKLYARKEHNTLHGEGDNR